MQGSNGHVRKCTDKGEMPSWNNKIFFSPSGRSPRHLSPFLFNIVFDYLLKNLVNEPNVTSLFFADDVAIISSSVVDLQNTLDKWRSALEENGFRISRSKTEHLTCLFSDPLSSMPDIYLDGIVLPKSTKFKYLGQWRPTFF